MKYKSSRRLKKYAIPQYIPSFPGCLYFNLSNLQNTRKLSEHLRISLVDYVFLLFFSGVGAHITRIKGSKPRNIPYN